MSCLTVLTNAACLTRPDGSTISVEKFTLIAPSGAYFGHYYLDMEGQIVDPDGLVANVGCCPVQSKVMVVRLSGTSTNVNAVAKEEGSGFLASDVGSSYTFPPEYSSYTAQWLGDTLHDATLEWNDVVYRAGVGSGSAGYAHASLPELSEAGVNESHKSPIIVKANPGAFVEIRIKEKI